MNNSIQGSVCVVNAASNRDIEVFSAGMIQVSVSLLENRKTSRGNLIIYPNFCIILEIVHLTFST